MSGAGVPTMGFFPPPSDDPDRTAGRPPMERPAAGGPGIGGPATSASSETPLPGVELPARTPPPMVDLVPRTPLPLLDSSAKTPLPIIDEPGRRPRGQLRAQTQPQTQRTASLPPLPIDAANRESRSILERRVTLAELLDVNAFRDVCASFVDLYKIGIKIFDADGTKLVDIRVGNGDWCGYIFQNRQGRAMCTNLVTKIKQFDYPGLPNGEVIEQECFSGLKYVIMPLTYGGDVLGRVIYGPFLPQELTKPGDAVHKFGEGFDPKRLWSFGAKIRRAPDETIMKILTNFRGVVDTITFIAMKSLMTQQLHVESITASYNELSAANRMLRESVDKLKELDRLKSNFLAMISHELRTPLTSVIGYSEMLLEGMAGDISDEQRDYIRTIKDKGESLLDLIGSLLDISKIEAGALRLNIGEFDPSEVVQGAISYVVPQAQKKNIRLGAAAEPHLPRVQGDREKIRQSVINLLGNAVKFTPAGGSIEVRAAAWFGARRYSGEDGRFGPPEERFLRIDVVDTGIGIPKDKLERVFDSFYQVDNSITREYGGTGLGLSIVKRFIEAHRGEVWVESLENVGTRFTLLVPIEATGAGLVPVVPRA